MASAQTIVFHNREAAFDPRVSAALRGADGIFLAGGDQGNYIRYWKGTPVQRALNAHVMANRPLGGSSAGLAILGHYSYTCLDGESMESKTALADPYHPGITLESDFLHLRWLESVITDTHFSARSRLGRLIVFLARINHDHPAQRVFGIGIDEKTALLVDADGVGRIAEGSAGSAWVVTPLLPAAVLIKGRPLTMQDIRIVRLDQSGSISLRSREITHPSAEVSDSIERGAPRQDALTSTMMMRSVVPPDEG
jgi:cyanophycinase